MWPTSKASALQADSCGCDSRHLHQTAPATAGVRAPLQSAGCNPVVVKVTGTPTRGVTPPAPTNHTDVADKQGSRLQNGPMQERYLPSVPNFSWECSVVSLHDSLKTRRCWCDSNRSTTFHCGKIEDPTGLISHVAVGATPTPAPILSECSLAVQALGLGPRSRRCESCRSDHFCFAQVCGSVSGAPARDAGEAGANPAHLTSLSLVEMK